MWGHERSVTVLPVGKTDARTVLSVNLCKICAGEHLLDATKEHKIIPIKQKWNPIKYLCPKVKHTRKLCDLLCKTCDNPICALCNLSSEHDQHIK